MAASALRADSTLFPTLLRIISKVPSVLCVCWQNTDVVGVYHLKTTDTIVGYHLKSTDTVDVLCVYGG